MHVTIPGQFSTGKTTCIQDLLLLGKKYPGSDVASAASTSKFTVIQPYLDASNRSAATETGRELASQPSKPFEPYSKLPNSEKFLKMFGGKSSVILLSTFIANFH